MKGKIGMFCLLVPLFTISIPDVCYPTSTGTFASHVYRPANHLDDFSCATETLTTKKGVIRMVSFNGTLDKPANLRCPSPSHQIGDEFLDGFIIVSIEQFTVLAFDPTEPGLRSFPVFIPTNGTPITVRMCFNGNGWSISCFNDESNDTVSEQPKSLSYGISISGEK